MCLECLVRIVEISDAPHVVTLKAADLKAPPISRSRRYSSDDEVAVKEYEWKKVDVGYGFLEFLFSVNKFFHFAVAHLTIAKRQIKKNSYIVPTVDVRYLCLLMKIVYLSEHFKGM